MALLTALSDAPLWIWGVLLAGVMLVCAAVRDVGAPPVAEEEEPQLELEAEPTAESAQAEAIEAELIP